MSQSILPFPHPLAACAAGIEDALDRAAGADPLYLPTATKREVLLALDHAATRLEALRLAVLATADDLADDEGARSVAAWVAHHTRVDPAAAASDHKLATALETHPRLRAGVHDGHVNPAQARVIVTALDDLPTDLDPQTRQDAETHLVAQAAHFDPRRLRILGRRILDILAPQIAEDAERRRLEAEERRARAHTRLGFTNLGGGRTRVTIDLPDATAGLLRTLLHAYTSPRRDHHAPEGQGRVDPDTGERIPHAVLLGQAFCALLEHVPTDRLPTHGRSPVTVVATIDHQRLTDQLGAAGLSTGHQISAGQARRLACTHALLPAVLDAASRVLDLGRTTRLFTPAQRRALELAHTTCQTDGCTIPAAWCEAHHHTPFSHGGPTDLANAVLLCPYHHHRIHDTTYDHTNHPDGTIRFHRRR